MKNKRGSLLEGYLALMIWGVISIIFVTAAYFYFSIGNDYVILNLYNVSQTMNNTAALNAGYGGIVTSYQSTNLDMIDNMWFYGYLIVSIIGLIMSYRTRRMNYFGFLSLLTYGLMFILFVAGLFGTVINWWYNDILLMMFTNLAVNVPYFAFYIKNYGLILLIQSAVMLLINMVDFDLASINNRKKKEQMSFDDELI